MAWIELHQSLWTHRKTLILAALIKIDETYAAAHLSRLWTWSLDNAPEGDLTGLPHTVIAYGAGYKGDATAFVSALVQAGWLDHDENKLVIHDWHDYAGRLVEKKIANKQRMKKAREKRTTSFLAEKNEPAQRTNDECATNVQRTNSERATHVQGLPNLTLPNHNKTTTVNAGDENYRLLETSFCNLHNMGSWNVSAANVKAMQGIISMDIPAPFAVKVMTDVLEIKRQREGEHFTLPRSFSYYQDAIKKAFAKEQVVASGGENNEQTSSFNRSTARSYQTAHRTPSFSDDELDAALAT